MNILILLLGLLFLAIILPALMPIISILIIIALIMNLRKMFSPQNYRRFEDQATRQQRLEEEQQAEEEAKLKKNSSSSKGYQLPRSVQDDEFFEREHRVLDVPYEEMDDSEDND